jgi:hypothetical protein
MQLPWWILLSQSGEIIPFGAYLSTWCQRTRIGGEGIRAIFRVVEYASTRLQIEGNFGELAFTVRNEPPRLSSNVERLLSGSKSLQPIRYRSKLVAPSGGDRSSMRSIFSSIVLALALNATLASQNTLDLSKKQLCTPPLAACNKPVKWVADKGNCSCFACEYGTATQHVGCTDNNLTKAFLHNVDESGWRFADVEKFSGAVSWSSDAATLTDKDGKSWEILNPDALKGHEGRHVQVSAVVDESQKNTILVTNVKSASAAKAERPAAKKKD